MHPNSRNHVFSRDSMQSRVRVRAFGHLASDSPPCASPIDPRKLHNGQKGVHRSLQKGLSLSSGSNFPANGCRGEAAKRLQSARPVHAEFRTAFPLQPFGARGLGSVIYVLSEVPRGRRFAGSTRPAGARNSRRFVERQKRREKRGLFTSPAGARNSRSFVERQKRREGEAFSGSVRWRRRNIRFFSSCSRRASLGSCGWPVGVGFNALCVCN